MLALGASSMRLAVAGFKDTVECRLVYGQWEFGTGDVVEIESVVADAAAARVAAELIRETETRTAGQ
jgi:hypothetical protein